MAAKEIPIGIALVLCDQILLDSATQKRSLIGLFNSVKAASFPAGIHKLCIFASITQINGEVDLHLIVYHEETNERILFLPAKAKATDPNAVLDLGFEFDKFSFPKQGIYCFELRGDDAIILSSRISVVPIERK